MTKQKPNIELPFFTYGIFRPGEIPFIGIKDHIKNVSMFKLRGKIYARDGIFFFSEGRDEVQGYLLNFKDDNKTNAYDFIDSLEPHKLFRWKEKEVNGIRFNLLVGRSPTKGSESIHEIHYDYSTTIDPYFKTGLDLLRFESVPDWGFDMKGSFQIQMRYMFLWTIIERFTFLRYSLGGNPSSRIQALSNNEYFIEALGKFVNKERRIYSAQDLDSYVLSKDDPKKAIGYYYQIRNNLTHRGKGITKDYDILKKSFEELLNIIDYVIRKTVEECQDLKAKYET